MRDNPLYGPWPAHVTATETQISRALAASIPLGDDVGMARDGLRFWPTASEVVWDEAEGGEGGKGGKGGKGEDAGGVGAGGRLSGREFALSRKRRRELREALPRVMTFGVMRREGGEREVDDDDLEAADVLEESASAVVQEEDCLAEPQARQDSPER